MMKKEAKIYGVGLGVGDPELITLKAFRVMRECDVIVLPTGDRENSNAYKIACAACPEIEEKETVCFEFPMTRDKETLEARRDEIFARVSELVRGGKTVAFLVIGDPSVYATYSYIELRAKKEELACESISGITSFTAAAARLGLPLVLEDEELHIIPGSADLSEAVKLPGTKVFMKLGKKKNALFALLAPKEQKGLLEVYAVEKCGTKDERVFAGLSEIPEDLSYLSTVVVKDRRGADS